MSSSTLLEKIDNLANDIKVVAQEASNNETARKRLLEVLMQSVGSVELPVETIWKMIMSPHAPASLMALVEMGVVRAITSSEKPKTSKELASSSGADELLIIRLLRPLCALGWFRETDVQTYTSTPLSQAFMAPPLVSGFQYMFAGATRSLAHLPQYLKETSYRNVSGAPGPFQAAHNSQNSFFEWLISDPAMMSNFNTFMAGNLETRKNWFDAFPAEKIVFDGASTDPESVLLIDIAGGEGHDIERFHQKFRDAPGRLVLQDLAPSINNIKSLDETITRQVYDFFTEQPIKGARIYFVKYIFHDWPTKDCVAILKNIAAAMKPGYSKLLIAEWILPAKDVALYPALLDINMMCLLNGMERTETQWEAMLNEAGLDIVKFWKADAESEGLIEAVVKK